jgi:hypothetical protein
VNVPLGRFRRAVAGFCAVAAVLAGSLDPIRAAELSFSTHAAFYSQETNRLTIIDPQIFVAEAGATAGPGPQNIEHVAGLRPAKPDDPPDDVALNADGASLGFTLGKWFGARGSAEIVQQPSGSDRITCAFSQLIAFGRYSLFEVTFSPKGAIFAPLDGDGAQNGFEAGVDGSASATVDAPHRLAPGSAIVLVYHSDGVDRGGVRGQIGHNAHQQLALRVPAAK